MEKIFAFRYKFVSENVPSAKKNLFVFHIFPSDVFNFLDYGAMTL